MYALRERKSSTHTQKSFKQHYILNNKEFISELSLRSGYTQENTQKLVCGVIEALGTSFDAGEDVHIGGFGTFELKKRTERIVVNPSTGQRMMVPPKLVLNFRPVASIKEQLKNGGYDGE